MNCSGEPSSAPTSFAPLTGGVTGLYYFNARWYDPSVGRFITQDSHIGSHEDPLSMNRYIYARDSPERYVDPTGHGMHIMITDGGSDDPNDQITTSSSCVNDVCTVTTTEVSGGYYSQISSTYGTTTDSSGTTTIGFSTTSTDTYSQNGVTTSTTTSWSGTAITPNGDEVIGAWANTVSHNSNTANSQLILIVGAGIFTVSVITGDPIGAAASFEGEASVYQYLKSNPNPDPHKALEIWLYGALGGFILGGFGATIPPLIPIP